MIKWTVNRNWIGTIDTDEEIEIWFWHNWDNEITWSAWFDQGASGNDTQERVPYNWMLA